MKLVPIIEIKGGQTQFGLPEREGMSARIKNPVLHVRYWIDQGAQSVFIKDCDGVIEGKPQHHNFLEYLDSSTKERVYYCGGIRDLRSVRIFEQRKYTKIVSATSLVENKKFLRNIIANNIAPISLWVDSIDGFVYTRNATKSIGKRTIDLVRSLPEFGIDEIFFCARSEHGVLDTPDYDMIENLLDLDIPSLYVADNVTSKEQLERLKQYESAGLAGVALKEPLYNGAIKIAEAKSYFKTENMSFE